jgi:rhomboid protease GluP
MNSKSKQSLLCPNCRKLISADEARCPYCGTAKPGSWFKRNGISRVFRDPDQFIKTIIYVNVAMFIFSILMSSNKLSLSPNPLTFLSPSNLSLLALGATGVVPIDGMHRWWSLISANYLHGGILHILFNMLALRQISGLIVNVYGIHRMFILYTIGGMVGFFVSYLAHTRFTIGSSAAICSLIGAALFYGKSRGGLFGNAVYRQIGGWVIVIFLFGFTIPGIDNWGHGGGIVAGAALGFILGYQEQKRENAMHRTIASICVLVTIGVLVMAVLSGVSYRI